MFEKLVIVLALAIFVVMVAYVSSYEKTVGKELGVEIVRVEFADGQKVIRGDIE